MQEGSASSAVISCLWTFEHHRCYNGDIRLLWEKLELWPPAKFKPLNKIIVTKFVTVDYVHDGNVRSKFGKKSVHGGLLGK